MLATLTRANRKLYTVRSVPCVALVGVGFLLRSRNEKINAIQKLRNYEKTCLVSSTKNNLNGDPNQPNICEICQNEVRNLCKINENGALGDPGAHFCSK